MGGAQVVCSDKWMSSCVGPEVRKGFLSVREEYKELLKVIVMFWILIMLVMCVRIH